MFVRNPNNTKSSHNEVDKIIKQSKTNINVNFQYQTLNFHPSQ